MSDAAPSANAPLLAAASAYPIKRLKRWQLWVLPALLLVAAGTVVYAWWAWHHWIATGRTKGVETPTPQLCWRIASAGLVTAVLLAVVIAMLNRLEAYAPFRRWYLSLPNGLFKRILLVVQIGVMALGLYVLGVYYLGLKVYAF